MEYKFKVGDHVEVNGYDEDNKVSHESVGVVLDIRRYAHMDDIGPYLVRFYDNDGSVIERMCHERELEYMMPSKPYHMRRKFIPSNKPLSDHDVEIVFKQVLEARKKLLGPKAGVSIPEEKDERTNDPSGFRHTPKKWGSWVEHHDDYNSIPMSLYSQNPFIEVRLKNGRHVQGFARNFDWTVNVGLLRITQYRKVLS